MEEHGLVERVRGEHDRRVVLVRATPRGHETIAELETVRRQHLRVLIEALDRADREVCLRAFQALRAAADRLDREPPAGSGAP
jgi:DNA-binding MarR family transcriptional regulator